MIQRYRVLGKVVTGGQDDLQAVLGAAYARKERVLCECRRHEELPLYISHRHDRYVLARWPGSGARHATACDHYEAPDFLTGMAQVRGNAVIDDEDTGETTLKLAFRCRAARRGSRQRHSPTTSRRSSPQARSCRCGGCSMSCGTGPN